MSFRPCPVHRQALYAVVAALRRRHRLTRFPIDAVALARSLPDLAVELRPFASPGFHGTLMRGARSLMVLNENRSPAQRNFDAAHELLHLWLDPPERTLTIDSHRPVDDAAMEWRCNEGAAELLMPLILLRPLAQAEAARWHRGRLGELAEDGVWLWETAGMFGVSEAVVQHRLRKL